MSYSSGFAICDGDIIARKTASGHVRQQKSSFLVYDIQFLG
jgi:hypothetical protein